MDEGRKEIVIQEHQRGKYGSTCGRRGELLGLNIVYHVEIVAYFTDKVRTRVTYVFYPQRNII